MSIYLSNTRKHKRMELVCRQSQVLTNIHELGVSMKRDPRGVILPFFNRIETKEYFDGFMKTVEDFKKKIKNIITYELSKLPNHKQK